MGQREGGRGRGGEGGSEGRVVEVGERRGVRGKGGRGRVLEVEGRQQVLEIRLFAWPGEQVSFCAQLEYVITYGDGVGWEGEEEGRGGEGQRKPGREEQERLKRTGKKMVEVGEWMEEGGDTHTST